METNGEFVLLEPPNLPAMWLHHAQIVEVCPSPSGSSIYTARSQYYELEVPAADVLKVLGAFRQADLERKVHELDRKVKDLDQRTKSNIRYG